MPTTSLDSPTSPNPVPMNRLLTFPQPSRVPLRTIPHPEIDPLTRSDGVEQFDLVWARNVGEHTDSRFHALGSLDCLGKAKNAHHEEPACRERGERRGQCYPGQSEEAY